MKGPSRLRVILVKPSKYDNQGYVERFRWGFMPNSTLPFMRSMTPQEMNGCQITVDAFDEYILTNLDYLQQLRKAECPTLLALVGVQSIQFQRALDLAALAKQRGVEHCVIGGPHPMTCDTTMLQERGVSFALAEAEIIWPTILHDAIAGDLRPVYGEEQRWQQELDSPVLIPPGARDLKSYVVPMLGIYPARGCPFTCNFCSVIKIAGRRVRSQAVSTTIQSLLVARQAGVKIIMFTSDNFNKYSDAKELLQTMIDIKIDLSFFVQCDAQIAKDEEMVALLGRAGCAQMFIGVESFDRTILAAAKKFQNRPEHYETIVQLCGRHGITTHFSNIIGFPEQDEAGILEHLRLLRSLRPTVASFYILTPIPGTEQYDDFLARGLITTDNLDDLDATNMVWRHPRIDAARLRDLMWRCYREFNALPDVLMKAVERQWSRIPLATRSVILGYSLHSRIAAFKRRHPMAGGIGRAFLDVVRDYLPLRQARYGFRLVPLPKSLQLSEADRRLNRVNVPLEPQALPAKSTTSSSR